jgi:F-type H+-transporting ATPase subunit epsilon
MNTFHLRILAPERTFFDGACASLTVPTIDGMYGVMAQHEDVVIAIVPGKLTLRGQNGDEQIAAVSEGLLKMENGEALLLVDTIERPEEIDLRRAEKSTRFICQRNMNRNNVTLLQKLLYRFKTKHMFICRVLR